MIALVSVTAMLLGGGQAGINGPRNAFNDCLTQTATRAISEKVAGDAYEAYLQAACGGKIAAFKNASIAFDVHNRIARKQATEDADAMIADMLQSAIGNYKRRVASPAKP